MKKTIWTIVVVVLIISAIVWAAGSKRAGGESIKVGWVSDLSGSVKKYGAYEAGKLAVDEINAAGGINGKPLDVIFEDGKCASKDAVSAATKLIQEDGVKVILGGHCTPESAAIAPIAEQNKVVMLAGITSSPVLSSKGQYIFRTTSVSVIQSDILSKIAVDKLGAKNMAIVFEQTDYARPIAEEMKSQFASLGGNVSVYEGYSADTNDFKTVLAKVKAAKPDIVFLDVQRPDAGINLVNQMNELGIKAKIFGNDIMSAQAVVDKAPDLLEGMIFAGPNYDPIGNPKTKKFTEDFKAKWGFDVPFGIFTAESYDGVYIIADAIRKYGNDADKIRDYLANLKGYEGASGTISINQQHDGERVYVAKVVSGGKPAPYR